MARPELDPEILSENKRFLVNVPGQALREALIVALSRRLAALASFGRCDMRDPATPLLRHAASEQGEA
jgi:hypothetical protein